MKIVLIFDQGLSGSGGKSNPNQELAIARGGIGTGLMLQPFFEKIGAEILATLYCGSEYFLNNKSEVVSKMTKMVKKLGPDMVLCGPCFNFEVYGLMAAMIAKNISDRTDIPAFAMMSKENEATIEKYKDSIDILKMPKKGEIGLTESFENLSVYMNDRFEGHDLSRFEALIYR